MQGMAMIVKVGDPEQFPKPDDDFPVCGLTQSNRRSKACPVSGGVVIYANDLLLAIVCMLQLYVMSIWIMFNTWWFRVIYTLNGWQPRHDAKEVACILSYCLNISYDVNMYIVPGETWKLVKCDRTIMKR